MIIKLILLAIINLFLVKTSIIEDKLKKHSFLFISSLFFSAYFSFGEVILNYYFDYPLTIYEGNSIRGPLGNQLKVGCISNIDFISLSVYLFSFVLIFYLLIKYLSQKKKHGGVQSKIYLIVFLILLILFTLFSILLLIFNLSCYPFSLEHKQLITRIIASFSVVIATVSILIKIKKKSNRIITTKRCNNCGVENKIGTRFCSNCGTQL